MRALEMSASTGVAVQVEASGTDAKGVKTQSSVAPQVDGDLWRVRPAGRVAGAGVASASALLAAGVTAGGGVSVGVIVLLWCVTIFVALGAWRWAFVPYVALGSESLVVQNRLLRSTVMYRNIASARAGYYGVTIEKRDGTRTCAWAVQKSNVARAGGTRTRVDDLVDAIMLRVHQTGQPLYGLPR